MTWFAWRQFRTQTWITIGALAAIGVVLLVTGRSIADAYADTGVAACGSDCTAAIDNFLDQARSGTPNAVYNLAEGLMYAIPAVIGIFWGAPLIARELETGTHRLAWNQSVTRTRWLATKLLIVGTATAATTGLLSWAVTTWAHRIDSAAGDRITPMVYGARGIVPIGYALFAFALGVTAGMLIRRTVPAMAATLAGYAAVAVAMPQWIRAQLVPASHTTSPLDMSELDQLGIDPTGGMRVVSDNLPEGAWVLSNQTITPIGEVFSGPADPQVCGREAATPGGCEEWVSTLGLRQDLTYQPANHFWPLQWIETGILLGVAVLLTGFCFWWLRRRVS
jgi:hypothetical protein